MFIGYLKAAMRHARYEILDDDGTFYGEIPECNGVYANAATLEACAEIDCEKCWRNGRCSEFLKTCPYPSLTDAKSPFVKPRRVNDGPNQR